MVTKKELNVLLEIARKKSGNISMCSTCDTWEESVIENWIGNKHVIMLWYNNDDHSTKVVYIEKEL